MQATASAPAPRDVLYVEDNPLNALLMHALFERRPDLHLTLAPDCASALASAAASEPALLLLDLRLPDGHGCTLLPQLRALPGLCQVPAVAVTAEAPDELDLRDFDGFWPKPLAMADVLGALDRLLPRTEAPCLSTATPGRVSPRRAASPASGTTAPA